MSALLARRYLRRAERELERGDLEAAADSFRAAKELFPPLVSASIGQAVTVARLGDTPRAAQILRAAIARRPVASGVRAALWRTLGDVLTKGGDYLGALDGYEEARKALAVAEGGEEGARRDAAIMASLFAAEARLLAKLGRYPESLARLAESVRARG